MLKRGGYVVIVIPHKTLNISFVSSNFTRYLRVSIADTQALINLESVLKEPLKFISTTHNVSVKNRLTFNFFRSKSWSCHTSYTRNMMMYKVKINPIAFIEQAVLRNC